MSENKSTAIFFNDLDNAVSQRDYIGDPNLVVIDGPENNFALITRDEAAEILDCEPWEVKSL